MPTTTLVERRELTHRRCAPDCRRGGPVTGRRQRARGCDLGSARVTCRVGSRRDDAVVFAQLTSGMRACATEIVVGYESYNDPLNHTDPTGERPTDDSMYRVCLNDPSGPMYRLRSSDCYSQYCPNGGLPADNESGGYVCMPPSDDLERTLHYKLLDQMEKVFAISGPAAGSPIADENGRQLANTEIGLYYFAGGSSGPPNMKPCATSERLHKQVFCIAPAPRATRGNHGLTVGHYVFCNDAEDCKPGALTLRHELVHVDQEERWGDNFDVLFRLEIDYLKSKGVGNPDIHLCPNRYEAEAYRTSGEMCF